MQRPQRPGELVWEGTVPPGEAEKPLPSGQSWGAWGSVAQVLGDGSSPGRAGRVEQGGRCALWGKCLSCLVLNPSPDARSESFCCALSISPRSTKAAPKPRQLPVGSGTGGS